MDLKSISSIESNPDQIIVMLLPARVDTKWFHQYIYNNPNVEVWFLEGRLKFENTLYPAPFPSMIIVFHNSSIAKAKGSMIDK